VDCNLEGNGVSEKKENSKLLESNLRWNPLILLFCIIRNSDVTSQLKFVSTKVSCYRNTLRVHRAARRGWLVAASWVMPSTVASKLLSAGKFYCIAVVARFPKLSKPVASPYDAWRGFLPYIH
jgi:hypothetical protein